MHTNYTLVTQTHLLPISPPLHSLQQFDLLTFKVFLARADKDRCPWEWTEMIFLSVTETVSVYLFISLSIFESFSVCTCTWYWHLLRLWAKASCNKPDQDFMFCLFSFALAEEKRLLSDNRLMSCQPAENTQRKDQTFKERIGSLLFYTVSGYKVIASAKTWTARGEKTEVCILLTENTSFYLLNCRWLGFKSHKSVTVLQAQAISRRGTIN